MADAGDTVTINFNTGGSNYEILFTYHRIGKDTLAFDNILIKKNDVEIDDLSKTDDIKQDNRVYIKNIVNARGEKKDREATEKFLKDNIKFEEKDQDSLTKYIRKLLREKLRVEKNIPANVNYQFKHSKKLYVKKPKKSRSKSLRKSKPRRKVKTPNQKKIKQV